MVYRDATTPSSVLPGLSYFLSVADSVRGLVAIDRCPPRRPQSIQARAPSHRAAPLPTVPLLLSVSSVVVVVLSLRPQRVYQNALSNLWCYPVQVGHPLSDPTPLCVAHRSGVELKLYDFSPCEVSFKTSSLFISSLLCLSFTDAFRSCGWVVFLMDIQKP